MSLWPNPFVAATYNLVMWQEGGEIPT
jgi:hypothetical protein